MKLKKMVKRAIDSSEIHIDFEELNSENAKNTYNIKNTPALIIDGNVKSEGKVLTEREISKLLVQE